VIAKTKTDFFVFRRGKHLHLEVCRKYKHDRGGRELDRYKAKGSLISRKGKKKKTAVGGKRRNPSQTNKEKERVNGLRQEPDQEIKYEGGKEQNPDALPWEGGKGEKKRNLEQTWG